MQTGKNPVIDFKDRKTWRKHRRGYGLVILWLRMKTATMLEGRELQHPQQKTYTRKIIPTTGYRLGCTWPKAFLYKDILQGNSYGSAKTAEVTSFRYTGFVGGQIVPDSLGSLTWTPVLTMTHARCSSRFDLVMENFSFRAMALQALGGADLFLMWLC